MLPYQWIVFDSTGTLMTPDPEPAQIYRAAALRFGGTRSLDQVREDLRAAMMRHFFGDTADAPTSEAYEYQRWRRIVADTLPEIEPGEGFASAFDSLWHHFAAATAWRLFDDVMPALKRLRRRGYRIGIASNFDARLEPIVLGLGLDDLVDEVFISSRLGFSKPDPRFYHAIAARLHVSDPTSLLMIGDTYQGDVAAAEAAGWHARHLVREGEGGLAQVTGDL